MRILDDIKIDPGRPRPNPRPCRPVGGAKGDNRDPPGRLGEAFDQTLEVRRLAELREHFNVLAALLRPYYETACSPLCEALRRDTCQLIIEMDALLREAEATLILRAGRSPRRGVAGTPAAAQSSRVSAAK